jgi:hypothetical protein
MVTPSPIAASLTCEYATVCADHVVMIVPRCGWRHKSCRDDGRELGGQARANLFRRYRRSGCPDSAYSSVLHDPEVNSLLDAACAVDEALADGFRGEAVEADLVVVRVDHGA